MRFLSKVALFWVILFVGVSGTDKRGHVFSLEEKRTTQVYRDRLDSGWALFDIWLRRQTDRSHWLDDLETTNYMLTNFVQDMFEGGEKIWLVRHAVLAVQTRFFALRSKIPRPWDALRGWKRTISVRSRVPVPELLLSGIFAEGLSVGLSGSKSAGYFVIGVVLFMVAYEGLLRPAELLRLRACDVKFVWFEGKLSCVLALRDPKNRSALGASQFARIASEPVALWLKWLLEGVPGPVRLWTSTRAKLVWVWNVLLDRLGVAHLRLTLGSMRPGKATQLILAGVHPGTVKFAGRWASDSSFHIYIQESMAMLIWSHLPDGYEDKLRAGLKLVEAQLLAPPTDPWQDFFNRNRQWRTMRVGKRK